jgi:hypothetical protein
MGLLDWIKRTPPQETMPKESRPAREAVALGPSDVQQPGTAPPDPGDRPSDEEAGETAVAPSPPDPTVAPAM